MVDMEALLEPNDHLRNHVQHLLQTHELYLIQWESRLNNAVAKCGKPKKTLTTNFFIMRLAGERRPIYLFLITITPVLSCPVDCPLVVVQTWYRWLSVQKEVRSQ